MQTSFVRAKKHLGQHFLKDQNIARKIVDCLQEEGCYAVLEIGPGTGILTGLLVNKFKNLWLVEIDRESVEFLNRNEILPAERIIEGDFIKMHYPSGFPEQFCIIGNFPYNISSQIFFRVLEERDRVKQVVCMVQKEVAQRISAPPGSKVYGILSVLLQSFYKIEYLFTVSEKVFDPPPKVKSAVIRLSRNERKTLDCSEEFFFKVVKTAFNQRRKILRNSLKSLNNGIQEGNIFFSKRPEQLSVDEFMELTRILEKKQ